MKKPFWILFLFCLLLSLLGAWFWRSPFLFKLRNFLPWFFAFWSLLLGWIFYHFEIRRKIQKPRQNRRRQFIALGFFLASWSLILYQQIRFTYIRAQVLNADPLWLREVGSHFIVGFTRDDEIRTLVQKSAVGGIFLTRRNIKGKSFEQVRAQILEWQALKKSQQRSPLWIAADQEGGLVSRLSPLVPFQPSLNQAISGASDSAALEKIVRDYAQIQGAALAGLGINVNFSPVADLGVTGSFSAMDRNNIALRAISPDPKIVTQVVQIYSQELQGLGVAATLKHFPGLGRIVQDTHVSEATLNQDLELLRQSDWLPYVAMAQDPQAWMMLGHVRLGQVDADNPASVSKKVVQNIVRRELGFQGKIVTDDLVMAPIYQRKGGVGQGAHDALAAGVDYVLLAYDPDLYYEAMYALLQDREGTLNLVLKNKFLRNVSVFDF